MWLMWQRFRKSGNLNGAPCIYNAKYNLYICILFLVVGEKERDNETVNIRTRDNKVHGERSMDQVKEMFKVLAKERILNSEEYGLESKES